MNTNTTQHPLTVPATDLQHVTWHVELQTHLFNRKPRLDPASIKLAMQHIRVFAGWYTNKFNQAFIPSLLTNYDLHLYRAHSLEQEKVKAATWNSRLWALTHLTSYIGDPGLITDIEGKTGSRGSTKHRALTNDEYHRLIHAIEQNTKRAVTLFEYNNAVRAWASTLIMLHGLRVDEAASLCTEDITINERSGYVIVRDGKGHKERTVPINLIGRKALASHLHLRPASTTTVLFQICVRTLQREISSLGAQIGVPDLTCHWLRYTFAKRLEANGTPIETIRDLLGHESIETTRRYLRSSIQELQSAVEGVM
jgi:integrase/recombinase XerC